MAQVTKDKIRWDSDDWMSGIIPQYNPTSTSAAAALTYGKGFAFARNLDPNRSPGYLQPGCTGTNATNNSVVDAYLKNAIPNGDSAYLIGGTKVHQLTISTNTFTNNATFPHTISAHGGHNSVDGQDVALYYIGTTKYLFYSWNDNTDGDIGRYDLSATFDDDYMSMVPAGAAALTSTNPRPMIVGDDNKLYTANGNKVASFDGQTGANGTFNANALDLPSDYVITSFSKLPNYLVIFAYKSSAVGAAAVGGANTFTRSESTAFIWDYVSDSFTRAYDLDGNYVAGGFKYQNTVGCFVQGNTPELGSSKQSRLMLFDGSKFVPKFRFRQNVPQWGGVEVISDTIYWLAGINNGNSVIYQYGSPYEGMDNKFNSIAECAGDASGLLRELSSGSLSASSGATTTGGLQKFSGTGYQSTAICVLPQEELSFTEFSQGRAKQVKIYWAGTSDTHAITVSLNIDRGVTTTTIVNNLSSVTSLLTKYEEDTSALPLPRFSSIGLSVSWACTSSNNPPPIIQAVEVFYEPVNVGV
jgi:hypothetical protein